LLGTAQAYWNLGDGGRTAEHSLKKVGHIDLNKPAEGDGAIAGAKVARMTDAYFDAGKELNVSGSQATIYLRVRDPQGLGRSALFSKLGDHEHLNLNLYSVPGTIGFECHTEKGFQGVTFATSEIKPTAWHDLIGRYDGQSLELICDGKVMAHKPWAGGTLTQNQIPLLIGAEMIGSAIVRPFSGEMEEAAIWARALSDEEVARLVRKDAIVAWPKPRPPYDSPIHYRPKVGVFGDVIPFYWKGEYHIFYLRGGVGKVPWEHIVSTDLIHWKELPTALVSDGPPDGPDGGQMFTGSVCEKDGTFHAFYTGHNAAMPAGREFVMHATSLDLIHWTKHPKDIVGPDGVQYATKPHIRDWRDPYVFWNEDTKEYWMVLCANSLKGGGPGLMVSPDMKKWTPAPALKAPNQECPDLFKIGDTWYLIGGNNYRFSKDLRGVFKDPPVQNVIDAPGIYAGKRMFDGKRHVWTGWIWDCTDDRDGGDMTWGGTQCLPRELYAGPNGQLYQRPVDEVTAVFAKNVLDIREPREVGTGVVFPTPDNYMLECHVQLDPESTLTLNLRRQPDGRGGYNFVMRAKNQEAELNGPGFVWPRRCTLDARKPIKFQAFVQGTIIECFVNDQFAYTCRAYNYPTGALGLKVEGGNATLLDLTVKTPGPEKP
jgi:sucrose-6-phosphate hydrolase SacC (GH32 family)